MSASVCCRCDGIGIHSCLFRDTCSCCHCIRWASPSSWCPHYWNRGPHQKCKCLVTRSNWQAYSESCKGSGWGQYLASFSALLHCKDKQWGLANKMQEGFERHLWPSYIFPCFGCCYSSKLTQRLFVLCFSFYNQKVCHNLGKYIMLLQRFGIEDIAWCTRVSHNWEGSWCKDLYIYKLESTFRHWVH